MPASTHRNRSAIHVIHLQPTAPAKPLPGDACNGCGVCCALEPCPLGMMLSAKRRGACVALQWSGQDGRYCCAAVVCPERVLGQALTPRLRCLVRPLAWLLRAWAPRWIAAGRGCDSDVQVQKV